MNPVDYINTLINFYTEISKYPLVQLTSYDRVYQVKFRDIIKSFAYNLGFKIKRSSWCTGKLASDNILKLESVLAPEYHDLMIGIDLGKKLRIRLFDIYGNIIYTVKIKFITINF